MNTSLMVKGLNPYLRMYLWFCVKFQYFQATKGKESFSFFSLPEYAEWRNNTENWKTYRIKYYKGL